MKKPVTYMYSDTVPTVGDIVKYPYQTAMYVVDEVAITSVRIRTLGTSPGSGHIASPCGLIHIGTKYKDKQKEEATMQPKNEPETLTQTQYAIKEVCAELEKLLLDKNRKYGDSAINPIRCFSQASPMEQIKVRMDDKINRIRNQQGDEDEDVIADLAGYCILYMVARKLHADNGTVGKS